MAGPSQPTGVVPRVGLALLVSVLAGVLLAGFAFPVVGGVGLLAKKTTDEFLALPADLSTPALATRSRVLAADGSVIATFYRVNRVEAPLASIPTTMRQAIVAIEDSRFYEHNGVDYKGTVRAAVTNLKSGSVAQGGSTLTQQYVKNALIEAATDKAGQAAATADTADRKLREARYALALEEKLSKDEILHRYLDIAYFGNGVYGVGTAATYYFSKPVEQLTLAESALLAGVVQQPRKYNVASKDPDVRTVLKNRRDTVLGRMLDLGYIPQAVHDAAVAEPLPVVSPTEVGRDCGAPGVQAPFFCDYVRHELEDTDLGRALGATVEERQNKLFGGGLTIQTSLDPRVQAAAQKAVDEQLPNGDPTGAAAVSNVVEPGNGAIRAMAVDRPYGEDKTQGQTQVSIPTGGAFGFQPGSTFKAFFLAEALRQGIPLSTKFDSPAHYFPKAFSYKGDDGKPRAVDNAGDSESGVFDVRTGTVESVNTFYIQLAERTGLEKPLALAESLGVRTLDRGVEKPLPRVPSAVLGSPTVSPLAMAGAYATFAAHGLYCKPRAILGMTNAAGAPIEVPAAPCAQVLEPKVADTVTSVLVGVINGPVPGRTGKGASIGRPAAGKTGTTNESKAAWFVGFTPQYAAAVWVGVLPNPKPMIRIRIAKRYYPQVYGGTLPASIWRQTMADATAPLPVKGFAPADPGISEGDGSQVGTKIPSVTGRSYDSAVSLLKAAGFTPKPARSVTSSLPVGRVAYTSPRSGRSAPAGSVIYIYRSSGPAQPRVQPTTAPPAGAAPTGPAPSPPTVVISPPLTPTG